MLPDVSPICTISEPFDELATLQTESNLLVSGKQCVEESTFSLQNVIKFL